LEFKIRTEKGSYDLEAFAKDIGRDFLVAIWGGEKPHIGAVAMAQPRPSLKDQGRISATASVFCYLGHKEDIIAKDAAEKISSALNTNVTVTAGIHWDDINDSAIGQVVENSRHLIAMIIERITAEKKIIKTGRTIMSDITILDGKKVLVVDDEPDVLVVLKELLSMCDVTTASSFDQAKERLMSQPFDIAILDIMGVDGYGLLDIAKQKNIPAIMLTAHAFTPDNLVRSIKEGAVSYIPKEELTNIADFMADVLKAKAGGRDPWESWQQRLPASFFEKRWGAAWQDTDKEFWDTFRASIRTRDSKSKKLDKEK
jgi:CheY-like chemotaxis protein